MHKRVTLTPLTPLAVLLDQMSLRIKVVRLSKRDIRFVLDVEHAASKTYWHRARSFDEYKQFQTRLLAALRLGHYCKGECPWLYSFVKSYFPGSFSFFSLGAKSDCAVEKRRIALEHMLTSLQKFLVDPHNASACSIVAGSMTKLMVDFVLEGLSDKRHLLDELRGGRSSSSNLAKPRNSICSSISMTSDEADDLLVDNDDTADQCSLCSCSLHSRPMSPSADRHRSSSSRRSGLLGYTTTLSCGHRFHDECIVQKLNEEMRCPDCRVRIQF
ncbi:conserved hypothetical protein [Plasmopara halstedii]|uniref:RING-type domain-containing protein n=1 Tax=Plasmopara halstedii TaxID=4781 RepID=A0A0P1ASM7_PLAHL|nr:conserved hypothetical protein [Plasmopara halstedii]CEG44984.1 conserved hypothetical protein [Plasmopara halstedii]|eukprot:XP_024581353.1 conserved hypothetical protein [Plasmopara halstedii]